MPNFFNKLLYSGGLDNQLNVSDFPSRYISIVYVTSYEIQKDTLLSLKFQEKNFKTIFSRHNFLLKEYIQ